MRRGLISVALFAAFVVIFTLSRHTTTPTTTTTSSTTSTSAPITTTTSGTTCHGADFSGAFNQGQGAAGTIYASVTLTMKSGAPCTIDGWPVLTLQDKTGAVLPLTEVLAPSSTLSTNFPDSRANQAPAKFSVHQGSTATFSLYYNDVPVGNTACVNAVTISVQLQKGGSAIPVTPDYPIQPCDNGRIVVSPLY
ncbi:MAG TPA: DUF4232 domain-containing protein [Acidimicrobiales bacterium]|nr:DUF4232 domain-containing protein [Acidimicrobiales bacterium]